MVAALCGFPARPRLRPHAGPAPRRRYERRRPEKTPLHKIISENLASWLEWRDEINQADLAALGVWLVFYQEKVPDPFWAQGERDRHRLLTQTEPVPAAAAADMLTWENSGFLVDATCSDHAQ